MKINNISGVILAGGSNSRFDGRTKANLVLNGRTIISGIAEILNEIFPEIIIVTNSPEEFNEYSGHRITGDFFKKVGPLGGIHAAMKASSSDAVFIVAGDMPSLNKSVIIRQADYFLNNSCDALIPSVNQNIEPLHAIYRVSVIKKLEEYLLYDSGHAVREFLTRINTRYMELDDSEETKIAFTNINTPSDFINFKTSKK